MRRKVSLDAVKKKKNIFKENGRSGNQKVLVSSRLEKRGRVIS